MTTDDFDDNDRELKFILASFYRFTKPDHLYQALRNEFLHGSKLDVLLINMMRYFDINNHENRQRYKDIKFLFDHKKFDYLFQIEPKSFQGVAEVIMKDFSKIRDFQEYLLSNPDRFAHF